MMSGPWCLFLTQSGSFDIGSDFVCIKLGSCQGLHSSLAELLIRVAEFLSLEITYKTLAATQNWKYKSLFVPAPVTVKTVRQLEWAAKCLGIGSNSIPVDSVKVFWMRLTFKLVTPSKTDCPPYNGGPRLISWSLHRAKVYCLLIVFILYSFTFI